MEDDMGTAPGEGFQEEEDDISDSEDPAYDPFDPTDESDAADETGWTRRHLVWLIVGGVVVLGGVWVSGAFTRSVPFRVQEDTIVVRDTQGDAIEQATRPELPEGFPSDIPIFPAAELQTEGTYLEGGEPTADGSIYTWAAPTSGDAVASWYDERLDLAGWEIATREDDANGTILAVFKQDDDARRFLLTFTERSDERTDISLVFGE